MKPLAWMLGAAWALGSTCAAVAQAHDTEAPRVVESCVSSDRLFLGRADSWVALDDRERSAVFEQMIRRYPVLQNDGVQPSHIILWRQPAGAWLYVTLLAHPARPGQTCFTATIVARGLDITTALLQKYFALRAAQAGFSATNRPATRS